MSEQAVTVPSRQDENLESRMRQWAENHDVVVPGEATDGPA